MVCAKDLIKALTKLKSVKRAKWTAPYLGIKPGFYGDGDKLLGLTMPQVRKIVKDYQTSLSSLAEIQVLFDSEYHEIRMSGLIILQYCYKKCSTVNEVNDRKKMYEFYLKNVRNGKINNWDFIDNSAPQLTGAYLFESKPEDRGRSVLVEFSQSRNLWMRRVAVLSTFYHIKQGHFDATLELGELLIRDEHHLIHKAVGWMLREIGKNNEKTLIKFLDEHCKKMPRVMLSYATEKLDKSVKKHYSSLKNESNLSIN